MGDIQPDPAYDALMAALGKKRPLTLTLTKFAMSCGLQGLLQRAIKKYKKMLMCFMLLRQCTGRHCEVLLYLMKDYVKIKTGKESEVCCFC